MLAILPGIMFNNRQCLKMFHVYEGDQSNIIFLY